MSLSERLRRKSPFPPTSARELAVLRLLGRLGAVMGQTIHDLVCFDQHENTCRNMLNRMSKRKLIWEATVANVDDAGRSLGRAPNAYGLTDDGRQLLDAFGTEPHDGTFERLIYRSKQAPFAPAKLTLTHDTYVSDWCASLLDQVRRTPTLAAVQVQRHYALAAPDGAPLQTIGAVIVLAFDPELTTFGRPGWMLPWLSDGPMPASWRVVRLALEVDTGAMSMRSVFELARTYQTLSENGTYQRLLGGKPRPVIVTPSSRRARAVAEVWMGAWENSPALLSSIDRTCHREYGVLWGTYKALNANPLQKANLLGSLLGTVEQWPAKTQRWPGSGSPVSPATGTKQPPSSPPPPPSAP